MEKQKTNTEIIIERRDIPPPICAVYYHPILVIASHLSRGDAIEIQEIFNKKAPAINSGFNYAIAIRQNSIENEPKKPTRHKRAHNGHFSENDDITS